jgi:hypothetical protein
MKKLAAFVVLFAFVVAIGCQEETTKPKAGDKGGAAAKSDTATKTEPKTEGDKAPAEKTPEAKAPETPAAPADKAPAEKAPEAKGDKPEKDAKAVEPPKKDEKK